jgi:branched-subunit amino acid transport protein
MDRNIITVEAAASHNRARAAEFQSAVQRYAEDVAGLRASLPPGTLGGELPIDLQKPDDWYQRILKYIPVEAMTAYIALDKGTQILTAEGSKERIGWLALALLVCVAFNIAYLIRTAKVRSREQVGVSSLALIAFVYIGGGVFEAEGLSPPIAQLFVLVGTGLVLTFFKPPAIEPSGN